MGSRLFCVVSLLVMLGCGNSGGSDSPESKEVLTQDEFNVLLAHPQFLTPVPLEGDSVVMRMYWGDDLFSDVLERAGKLDRSTMKYSLEISLLKSDGTPGKKDASPTAFVPNQLLRQDLGDIIAKCKSLRGIVESVTVMAGTFDTCKFDTSHIIKRAGALRVVRWVANVPMGMVKDQISRGSGVVTHSELVKIISSGH